MKIDVRRNIKEVSKTMSKLDRQVIPKATVTALNRSKDRMYTKVVRELAKATGIKQKELRQLMLKFKATYASREAGFTVRGKAPNLIRFNARQTKKGVSATAWGKRRVYAGSFIGNDGRTVFARKSAKRLPIKSLYGPAPPRELLREKIDQAAKLFGIEQFKTELRRAITKHLARYK